MGRMPTDAERVALVQIADSEIFDSLYDYAAAMLRLVFEASDLPTDNIEDIATIWTRATLSDVRSVVAKKHHELAELMRKAGAG